MHGARKAPERTGAGEPGERIECALSARGEVALEVVSSPAEVARFRELLDRYHELGYRQPVGCYLRYFLVDGPPFSRPSPVTFKLTHCVNSQEPAFVSSKSSTPIRNRSPCPTGLAGNCFLAFVCKSLFYTRVLQTISLHL